jgi:hypothetical protein
MDTMGRILKKRKRLKNNNLENDHDWELEDPKIEIPPKKINIREE